LPVGSKVEVSFWLPSGQEVVTTAEVRWVRDPRRSDDHGHVSPGMGVRFTSSVDRSPGRHPPLHGYAPPMFYDDE
jgi:hypothetical protein